MVAPPFFYTFNLTLKREAHTKCDAGSSFLFTFLISLFNNMVMYLVCKLTVKLEFL